MAKRIEPSQEALEAATKYINRIIAIGAEHGSGAPSAIVRASSIAEVAVITERWIRLAAKVKREVG